MWVKELRESAGLCRMDCADGLSTCGDLRDTDHEMVAECLACQESCDEIADVTCAGESSGVCPEPCGCE
jgi:hypothetical protein